ncbi:hypothetical protein CDAR_266551 [Caerostris darwini]|uniref:Uncharacterized protein n=1 Tax=Caerostris darwini TaxID=1538125 RepID=A0AAV4RU12_9ARAC|nr:hypothetical protein CDAR_266551 [Caerostris darwini]
MCPRCAVQNVPKVRCTKCAQGAKICPRCAVQKVPKVRCTKGAKDIDKLAILMTTNDLVLSDIGLAIFLETGEDSKSARQ